ncbi:MAG: hypothetical protein Tsb0020_16010 [Haliangiales bacterium]
MTRGPIIHAALLCVALIVAYQTWTREEVLTPMGGDIEVWSVPQDAVEAFEFLYTEAERDERSVRVERRRDDRGEYLWGREVRSINRYRERPEGVDPLKVAPVKERVDAAREFIAGERAAEAFENLAELRALREIGPLDDKALERFGLDKDDELITLKLKDGSEKRIFLGSQIYRTRDRYALVPETGIGYVLAEDVVRPIVNGESNLRITSIHDFKNDEVAKVRIEVGDQSRALVRVTATDSRGREQQVWADVQTPDTPDQTMVNFLQNVKLVQPSEYRPELDLSSLERVVRVEYQRGDEQTLGWIELYQTPSGDGGADEATPAAAYYMRTEVSRVLAVVVQNIGSQVSDDVAQIFQQ